jgi:hypothetical protein
MGLAIDTIAGAYQNPSTGATLTLNTGDSNVVRNFPQSAKAYLDFVARQGAAEGKIEINSPLLHDNTHALRWQLAETVTVQLMPREIGCPVFPSDNLTITIGGGTAEYDAAALGFYYTDLPGVSALIKSWADIMPQIELIKTVEVDFTTTANAAWLDTVITTTENLLKADRYYAVLGYDTDLGVLAAGIKGTDTGNLRICGPGSTTTLATGNYFVDMAERHNRPYIPLFAANNRNGTFFSCAAIANSATKGFLNLALLAPGYVP